MRARMTSACSVLLAMASISAARAETYGLTGISPVWPENRVPYDVVAIRFSFHIPVSESPLKLMFCFNRLWNGYDYGPYLIEANLYECGLRYGDGILTNWPMAGEYRPNEASLRIAAEDYFNSRKVGAKTTAPSMFPRQTYEIDGLENVMKTDLVSQRDMTGEDFAVTIERGSLVTNRAGWLPDGSDLPSGPFREWQITVTGATNTHSMSFAFPDDQARFLYPFEIFNFATEIFNNTGSFTIYLWDLAFRTEGASGWRRVDQWQVNHHDGDLSDFGVRLDAHEGHKVVAVSSVDSQYCPTNTVLYIGDDPVITNIALVSDTATLALTVPTNRFDVSNGFIVERWADLTTQPDCVASADVITNSVSVVVANAPAQFYRCQFGLHAVCLAMSDTNLASATMAAVAQRKVSPSNALYDLDLNGITTLDASGRQVSSLRGIEILSELRAVNLCVNSISDVAPLTNLSHLAVVALHDNHVSDVSPFGGMPWLVELHMWNNGIADAHSLSPLVNLRQLHLGWNNIADAGFLQGMSNLWFLALWNNQLSDITPLTGLSKLTQLYLSGNQITNLAPLIANAAAGGIGTNTQVWLSGNPLSDTNQVSTLRNEYGVTVYWP